jgi:hypothetical protein
LLGNLANLQISSNQTSLQRILPRKCFKTTEKLIKKPNGQQWPAITVFPVFRAVQHHFMTRQFWLIMLAREPHLAPILTNQNPAIRRCDQSQGRRGRQAGGNNKTKLEKKRSANKVDSQFIFQIVFLKCNNSKHVYNSGKQSKPSSGHQGNHFDFL